MCFHKKKKIFIFQSKVKNTVNFFEEYFLKVVQNQNPLEHHHWSKQIISPVTDFWFFSPTANSQFRLFFVASYSISLGIIQRLKNYFFWKCSRNVPRWVFSLELIENFDYLIICCNDFNLISILLHTIREYRHFKNLFWFTIKCALELAYWMGSLKCFRRNLSKKIIENWFVEVGIACFLEPPMHQSVCALGKGRCVWKFFEIAYLHRLLYA